MQKWTDEVIFLQYERLLPFVKGNVGFIFTNGDLKATRDKILANRVAAPARAGVSMPVFDADC